MTDTTVRCKHRWEKVAVLDGCGNSASWDIYRICEKCDEIVNLPWSDNWPKWVTGTFLASKGFTLRTA